MGTKDAKNDDSGFETEPRRGTTKPSLLSGEFVAEPPKDLTTTLRGDRSQGRKALSAEKISERPDLIRAWSALASEWAYPPPPGEGRVETEAVMAIGFYVARAEYEPAKSTHWNLNVLDRPNGET